MGFLYLCIRKIFSVEILDKLENLKNRHEEIAEQMSDPAVMADMKAFVKLNKDYKDLEPVVNAYKNYKQILADIEGAKEVLANEKDPEFRDMAIQGIGGFAMRRSADPPTRSPGCPPRSRSR